MWRTAKEPAVLMARETAPAAATEDMYVGDTTKSSVYGKAKTFYHMSS